MTEPTTERRLVKRVALQTPDGIVAFGFGSGLAPWAPGTFGSLAALLPYVLLTQLPAWQYGLVVVAAFALGIWVCEKTSHRLGVHDHGGIVWDEFVGLWIALFICPFNLWAVGLGFALFRLFDIVKPWPIGWLDRNTQGGLGIMIDDVVAGAYAWAALQTVLFLWQ